MDPNKDPTPLTNDVEAKSDSEINKTLPSTPREAQAGQGDMDVPLLTRPENPRQITSYQQQEPLPIPPDSRPGRSSEPASDYHNCASSSSQSSSHSKLNSNSEPNDSPTPSCSKANNGLENSMPHSINNVEVNKGSSEIQQSISGTSQENDRANVRENRKRPSNLILNRPNMDEDSSSASDYSLGSEDGCIYTYRGGEHLADLPSSFFSLDMGLPADRLAVSNYVAPQGAGNGREGSRASSPDMDFLEMDFDPGPSNEVDSGEASTSDADLDVEMDIEQEIEPVRGPSLENVAATCKKSALIGCQPSGSHNHNDPDLPSTSRGVGSSDIRPNSSRQAESVPHIEYGPFIIHVNARGDSILVRRTMSHSEMHVDFHIFDGDLIRRLSPVSENHHSDCPYQLSQINQTDTQPEFNTLLPAALYHTLKAHELIAVKKAYEEEQSSHEASSEPMPSTSTASASCVEPPRSMIQSEVAACDQQDTQIGTSACGATAASSEPMPSTSTASASCVEPPRSMIWSEVAACERQVTQIGTSACGATAVINVFNALNVPVDIQRINTSVGTRLRANSATTTIYILSRAIAGCTAADLVNGLQVASDGLVTARFFATYPERAMSLSHFLADWISLGAVPILTLNTQNEGRLPDAWHHQMVFGVSPQGIYLCNPLGIVRETALWPRLVSPSVVLVRAIDIVARHTEDTDLTPLMYVPDERFHTFNVFGQVSNVLRESRMTWRQDSNPRTDHIRIPAAYQAGITIAVLTGSEAHQRLMVATQLPLLDSRDPDNPQDDPA